MANLDTKTISAGVGDILAIDGGIDASTARQIKSGDGDVSPFYITQTKVGIGDTTPNTILHLSELNASGAGATLSLSNPETSGSTDAYVGISALLRSEYAGGEIRFGKEGSYNPESSAHSYMGFYTSNGNTNNLAMYIDKDGNVGIGTTAPDVALHITKTATGGVLRLENSDTTITQNEVLGQIEFEGQDGSTNAAGVRAKIAAFGSTGGVTGETDIAFYTSIAGDNLSEKMRIQDDGNVGIGTDTPAELLEVEGTSNSFIQISSGASNNGGLKFAEAGDVKWQIYNVGATDTPDKLIIQNGAGANGVYLLSDGTGATSDAWVNNSDERMKENLVEIDGAVNKLKTLRCVEYNYKHQDVSKVRMGVIAQDVYNVYPFAVTGNPSDGEYEYIPAKEAVLDSDGETIESVINAEHKNAMGVAYQELITPLIKAVQELSASVDILSTKVTALENA